jgi:glucuronate isomerase
MAENSLSNNQTKHKNTKYHFVRKVIENQTVKNEFIRSEKSDIEIFMFWGERITSQITATNS